MRLVTGADLQVGSG